MTELQQWIVTLRRGASGGDDQETLKSLLSVPGVELVQLRAASAGPLAVIRATPEAIEALSHVAGLIIGPDSSLSPLQPGRKSNTPAPPAGKANSQTNDSTPTRVTEMPNTETKAVPLTATEKRQYILAPRRDVNARLAGIQPMSIGLLKAQINSMNLDVVRTIPRKRRTIDTLGVGGGEATDLTVVRMEPERAQLLQHTMPPQLTLSEDKPLGYGGTPQLMRTAPTLNPFAFGASQIMTRRVTFRVVGEQDKPLPNIVIELTGDGFPASGRTGPNGEVALDLTTLGSGPARALFVSPEAGYWDLYLTNPELDFVNINLIRMRSLNETINDFPTGFEFGWSQRLMGLDRLPRELGGAGVKIAIIDSGCDNTHPLLTHVKNGQNFGGDSASWTQDLVGHGTHCAGIITARPVAGTPMRGFAPDAEVHVLRIFPGGQYSSLIEALDYCIDRGIDVINMSLGGDSEINQVVEETLQAAVMNGIVCIVAAGNSGDSVKYPAASPQVLAVAAVGNTSELQPNTWDSTTVQTGLVAGDGIFSPSFTCHGPQVRLCAPGVGIVSTVPGGQFEPQTGTSMAAPHVTGMAALLLAHHPAFRSQFVARDVNRVRAAFSLLQSLCTGYAFGADRAGSGVPKLDSVVNMLVQSVAAAAQPTAPQRDGIGATAPGMTSLFSAGPNMGPVSPPQFNPFAVGIPFFPFAQAPWIDPNVFAQLVARAQVQPMRIW